MIKIEDKRACCGCGACAEVCPVHAIAMHVDAEGFRYPLVDATTCISCGLCVKQYPFLTPQPKREDATEALLMYDAHAYYRQEASSGGAFSLLARRIIAEGGVVVGAAFDERWGVQHIAIEDADELWRLKGSKYVESALGDVYSRVKGWLKAGRRVMFTGTPCQVAGLKRALGKDYPQLLSVDIACHGVPSSMVWDRALTEWCAEEQLTREDIKRINFRSKVGGWKYYHFAINHTRGDYATRTFPYTLGFAHDLYLRPSCHACRVKEVNSYADITLADAWGVEQVTHDTRFLDDKGVSLLLVRTPRGAEAVAAIDDAVSEKVSAAIMLQHNKYITQSVPYTAERAKFFVFLSQGLSVKESIGKAHRVSLIKRLEVWLTPLLNRLGIKGFTKRWRRK